MTDQTNEKCCCYEKQGDNPSCPVHNPKKCKACGGLGRFDDIPCWTCGGDGKAKS